MSVNSNQNVNTSCELDILKVAHSLGIEHERMLFYIYSNEAQDTGSVCISKVDSANAI